MDVHDGGLRLVPYVVERGEDTVHIGSVILVQTVTPAHGIENHHVIPLIPHGEGEVFRVTRHLDEFLPFKVVTTYGLEPVGQGVVHVPLSVGIPGFHHHFHT